MQLAFVFLAILVSDAARVRRRLSMPCRVD